MRQFRNQLCLALIAILHSALPAIASEWNQSLKYGGFQLASPQKPKVELPENVRKAFKKAFPDGKIEKLDVDEENGVKVFDIEFRNGALEQETDIAADGTVLEVTLVVEAKTLPPGAMKAIAKASEGGKLGRIEKIDISYETRDGRIVKLPKVVTHFAAEFSKGDKRFEVVVTPDGALVKSER